MTTDERGQAVAPAPITEHEQEVVGVARCCIRELLDRSKAAETVLTSQQHELLPVSLPPKWPRLGACPWPLERMQGGCGGAARARAVDP